MVLSLAAIEAGGRRGHRFVILTSPDYRELFAAHVAVERVLTFDKRAGLRGWLELANQVRRGEHGSFDEFWDLHRSLRSFVFRARAGLKTRLISKQTLRRSGFFLFKRLWPRLLRPTPWVLRYAEFGGDRSARPNLTALLPERLERASRGVGLMPSSRWASKEVPIQKWAEWIQSQSALGVRVRVFGRQSDESSTGLVELIQSRAGEVESRVAQFSYRELASELAQLDRLYSIDTGMAHFAEAIGVPVSLVLGPTHPGSGFPPWRSESRVLGSELWCRPCSKDGRGCFRLGADRYRCLKAVDLRKETELEPPIGAGAGSLSGRVFRRGYRALARALVRGLERMKRWDRSDTNRFREAEVWFHGASVGEIEALMPVIEALGSTQEPQLRFGVSAFSPSAQQKVQRIPGAAFGALSPLEGSWGEALDRVKPKLFVTARYEAWPDLWWSLAERGIPLVVIQAEARASMRNGVRVSSFGGILPYGIACAADPEAEAGLRRDRALGRLFGQFVTVGDPRWERALSRRGQRTWRAADGAPFWVFGSAYLSDVEQLDAGFWQSRCGLVVPHHVDGPTLEGIAAAVRRAGASCVVRGSGQTLTGGELRKGEWVVCGEMGVLAPAYANADAVWVGGGFGKGVHSTIEPAVYGLPLVCGAVGASRFPEIRILRDRGQLRVCAQASESSAQVTWAESVTLEARDAWRKTAEQSVGAARRTLDCLRPILLGR